ncbi:MAG TPA: hypothetical protein PKA41_04595 [Verrucomicrobiota bacterium]|nr:hypothetical protein [Verrucomicrobiota bacterium]
MAYLTIMLAILLISGGLALIPATRSTALKLALAAVCSLPGMLALQFCAGFVAGIVILVAFCVNAIFQPSEPVQMLLGVHAVLVTFVTVGVASLVGCYFGGRIGWEIGAGKRFGLAVYIPFRLPGRKDP